MTNLTSIQTTNDFEKICPIMLYNFEIGNCEYTGDERKLSVTQIWIYGLLLSGVVTLWSWNGAVVLPIINKKIYKRVLTFMISLAFGTMTSNSLLKYIPLVNFKLPLMKILLHFQTYPNNCDILLPIFCIRIILTWLNIMYHFFYWVQYKKIEIMTKDALVRMQNFKE